ncbi:hypothetical protein [Paenibacillus sp. J2TS4]|nr:hypothetical protein [Paenibacillus sp. J2TS4]
MGFGPDVLVEEPLELINRIRERMEQTWRAYGRIGEQPPFSGGETDETD